VKPPEAESFFVFRYPKLSLSGGFSAAGSPIVESLVETFAPFSGTHSHGVEGNVYVSENLQGSCHKVSKSNLKMDKINKK